MVFHQVPDWITAFPSVDRPLGTVWFGAFVNYAPINVSFHTHKYFSPVRVGIEGPGMGMYLVLAPTVFLSSWLFESHPPPTKILGRV